MLSELKILYSKLGGDAAVQAGLAAAGHPVTWDAVFNWKRRNSVPKRWLLPLVELATAKGVELSVAELASLVPASSIAPDDAAKTADLQGKAEATERHRDTRTRRTPKANGSAVTRKGRRPPEAVAARP